MECTCSEWPSWWATVPDGKYALGTRDRKDEKQRTRSSLRSFSAVKWRKFQCLSPAHISSGPFSPHLAPSALLCVHSYSSSFNLAFSCLRQIIWPKHLWSFNSLSNFPSPLSYSPMLLLGAHTYLRSHFHRKCNIKVWHKVLTKPDDPFVFSQQPSRYENEYKLLCLK